MYSACKRTANNNICSNMSGAVAKYMATLYNIINTLKQSHKKMCYFTLNKYLNEYCHLQKQMEMLYFTYMHNFYRKVETDAKK